MTPLNKNITFGGNFETSTNEEHELAFYRAHFGESLDRKNASYKAKGKPGQIKTMDQYYRSVKSCPEETLYTVGKDIDPQLLWTIYLQHQEWKTAAFPLCQTLDASLHVDEPIEMPHIHERSVWIGHDAQGMEVVGQAKALAEMGVQPPAPDQKYGKFNNAKQTFTRICREHFVDVCREHGLEIIVEPLPPEKVGLELTEFKIQHARERAAEAAQELSELSSAVEAQKSTLSELKISQAVFASEVETARQKAAEASQTLSELSNAVEAQKSVLGDLRASQAEIEAIGEKVRPVVFSSSVSLPLDDMETLLETAKTAAGANDRVAAAEERAEKAELKASEAEKALDAVTQQRDDARAEIQRLRPWAEFGKKVVEQLKDFDLPALIKDLGLHLTIRLDELLGRSRSRWEYSDAMNSLQRESRQAKIHDDLIR